MNLRSPRTSRSVIGLLLSPSLVLLTLPPLAACEDSGSDGDRVDTDSGMDPATTSDAGGLDAASDDDGQDMGPDDAADEGMEPEPADDAGPDDQSDGGPQQVEVTIDFDDLPTLTDVTTQYLPVAEFSTRSAEQVNRTIDLGTLGHSPPNYLCTASSGGFNCDNDTIIVFPAPVSQLRFRGIGVNDTGEVASIQVYEAGALAATVPLVGLGDGDVPLEVDLSAFTAVTRIEITHITDYVGIGWDDFSLLAPAP